MNLSRTRASKPTENPLRTLSPLIFGALLAVVTLGGTGCSSQQQQADADEIDKRAVLTAQTDTQGAMQIWEEGLKAHPNNLKMRFHLGRIQYDTGEIQFIEERHCSRDARLLEDDGKLGEAQKKTAESRDRHAKGLPFYRAARDNLAIVAAKEPDSGRVAWTCYILAKCDIFFEDYDSASTHLDRAIELGHLTGSQLATWKEYLAEIKQERDKHTSKMSTQVENFIGPGH
jgi:tetratricopeptide (TPR) repeat protein